MTLQDTLTLETLDPEEVLKRAIIFEHRKLTTLAFQKTNAAATVGTGNNYNSGVRKKTRTSDGCQELNRKHKKSTK